MFKIYAPLRVDLCGGVTDIADFSSVAGTCITNIAVDLYLDETYKIKQQLYVEFRKSSFKRKDNLPLIKSLLNFYAKEKKIDVNFDVEAINDFPVSTGLGGSAALIVEIITGLHKLFSNGKNFKLQTGYILKTAYFYEVKKLNITGGFQDYISAFFGGLNFINFPSINNLNLKSHQKYLGLVPELNILNYLNENMIILILKEDNKSSAKVVKDQIKNFNQNRDFFISKLKGIKKSNEDIFQLLVNESDTEKRLSKIGYLINNSWDLQKQLSAYLGKGLLSKLELKLKPFVYGLRGPGSGANSLFLLLKKEDKKRVLNILEEYKDLIYIYYARVNTSGLEIIT